MSGRWRKLKHAFAVDPPGPIEPNEAQRGVVDRVCRKVAEKRLSTPAILGLEMARPLNYLGAMTMHTFAPAIWAIARKESYEQYNELAAYLERRGSIEWMINRIEELEAEFERGEGKAEKDAADGSVDGSPTDEGRA